MNAASSIESFLFGLLERLFAMLWNEFQAWSEQPGNFEKAISYIDEILANAGIQVNDPTGAPVNTPASSGFAAADPVLSAAPIALDANEV